LQWRHRNPVTRDDLRGVGEAVSRGLTASRSNEHERNNSKEQLMKVQTNVRAGLVVGGTKTGGGSSRCSGVIVTP
jgi:hypothetical protein